MYIPYLISPDSFWMGQKTTGLLKSTYHLVLPHTRGTGFQMYLRYSSANWGQIIGINLFLPQLLAIIGNYWQ